VPDTARQRRAASSGLHARGHTPHVATLTQTGELLAGPLRNEGRVVRFRRGQALFTEGDRAERVFVIERGWVTITSVASDGREIVLGLRGPGDVIGDLSALDGAPRSATALAVGQVEATAASGATLLRVLHDHACAMELLRVLAARLRDADRKRLEFATLDTLGRVAWRLLELSERFGRQTADGIEVELPLSQEQLASWCRASREATVKALAALRALGCIATARRSVLIRDARHVTGPHDRFGDEATAGVTPPDGRRSLSPSPRSRRGRVAERTPPLRRTRNWRRARLWPRSRPASMFSVRLCSVGRPRAPVSAVQREIGSRGTCITARSAKACHGRGCRGSRA